MMDQILDWILEPTPDFFLDQFLILKFFGFHSEYILDCDLDPHSRLYGGSDSGSHSGLHSGLNPAITSGLDSGSILHAILDRVWILC